MTRRRGQFAFRERRSRPVEGTRGADVTKTVGKNFAFFERHDSRGMFTQLMGAGCLDQWPVVVRVCSGRQREGLRRELKLPPRQQAEITEGAVLKNPLPSRPRAMLRARAVHVLGPERNRRLSRPACRAVIPGAAFDRHFTDEFRTRGAAAGRAARGPRSLARGNGDFCGVDEVPPPGLRRTEMSASATCGDLWRLVAAGKGPQLLAQGFT